jgi:hypothetical protein
MKKTLPLFLGAIAGFLVVFELFVPQPWLGASAEHVLEWGQILAAAALLLGGINIIQVNAPKIRRREQDWQYKLVLLLGAAVMLVFGVPWDKIGDDPVIGGLEMTGPAQGGSGPARLRIEASRPDAVVKIDGGAVAIDGGSVGTAAVGGQPRTVELEPGTHRVQVFMSAIGYGELAEEFTIAPGQTAVARAELPMSWGLSGRFRTWFYDHVFFPCNATMFALLAFFIASAAFRAFRARNTEAGLLLGSAILVLLGRAPIGRLLSDKLPEITNWIIDVPNNAGRRAIIIGAALGAIVTGLRVLLGMERQHVGGE